MPGAAPNTDYWDHFWQKGEASCCDDRGSPGQADAVERVWRYLFDSCPAGTNVVDLCTGNGSVLAIASASTRLRQGIGVDSARIRPLDYPACTFLRASAEALPLADRSVDLVVSQFGVEYTSVSLSLAEAARVLKPAGRVVFVMHAADGVTASAASRQLDDLHELLNVQQTFPAAIEALNKVVSVERAQQRPDQYQRAEAEAAYARFYSSLQWLGAAWQERPAGQVFRDTGALLQHTFQHRQAFPLAALIDKVNEAKASVRHHRDRLRALVDAALAEDGMQDVFGLAARTGLAAAAFSPIEADRTKVAWRFDAARAGERS